MKKATPRSAVPPPTQEQITQRAHRLWIEEGRPEGRHLEHWRRAEEQLYGGPGRAAAERARPTPPPHSR